MFVGAAAIGGSQARTSDRETVAECNDDGTTIESMQLHR